MPFRPVLLKSTLSTFIDLNRETVQKMGIADQNHFLGGTFLENYVY